MGCANNWLIPPAILLNNPGITREEFVELLNETRTGDGPGCYNTKDWKKYPWIFIGHEDKDYHEGLHGLAKILGLKLTKKFEGIEWKDRDRNGLVLKEPFFWISPTLVNNKWETSYQVDIHTRNSFLEAEMVEDYSWGNVKVGGVFESGFDNYFVEKIVEKRKTTREERKKFREEERVKAPKFFFRIIGRPIIREEENHNFCSLSSLVRKFPWFDPDFMFYLNQEEGVFLWPIKLREHNSLKGFGWRLENGRYYLNIENLPGIYQYLAWKMESQSGYTDLIVSAEALKLKAWKMFSYHGYERARTEIFLRAFPKAARAHAGAVWDAYTSDYARAKGMNITEFLRMRLEMTRIKK